MYDKSHSCPLVTGYFTAYHFLENGNFPIHCSENCMSQSEELFSNSNATIRVSALAYAAACNLSRMLNVWLVVSVIPDLLVSESVQCMLEV